MRLRKPHWDYNQRGWYFITICTEGRMESFGKIHRSWMCVSEVGSIVHQCWDAIPVHHTHVSVDAFIVMPDHVHGILCIDDPVDATRRTNAFGPLPTGSMQAIVHSFKAAVTRLARRQGVDFAWQSRFHDHVIADEEELDRIRRYIRDNPVAWWERHGHGPV